MMKGCQLKWKMLLLSVLLCGILSSPSLVLAVPLSEPDEDTPTGVTGPAGAPDATTGSLNFTINQLTGTLAQDVFLNTTTGGITGTSFRWTIEVDEGGGDTVLRRVTSIDFGGWLVDVDFIEGDTDPEPDKVDRTADGTIGWFWEFGNRVGTGDTVVLFAQTNAPSFAGGGTFLIDGGIHSFDTFAPVPEPSSLLLLGSGLAGFGFWCWRRRQATSAL